MDDTSPVAPNMHSGTWHPSAPVLLRDVWTLAVTYKADPKAVRRWLPPGLDPHPDGRVEMTMYEVPHANQTSGFGAFDLTYVTIEVAGHDGYMAEGSVKIPGRFWATYWNSSHRVRTFARESVGIPAQPGSTSWTRNGNALTSELKIHGTSAIVLKADVTDKHVATVGGLLNYYTRRTIPSLAGGEASLDELVYMPIPFVAETYAATLVSLEMKSELEPHVAALRPIEDIKSANLLFGKLSFTYSQARRLKSFLT